MLLLVSRSTALALAHTYANSGCIQPGSSNEFDRSTTNGGGGFGRKSALDRELAKEMKERYVKDKNGIHVKSSSGSNSQVMQR